ncbi:murein DD-endopeptidase MepM [Mariprofundus micogutta]|uniref:Murein DD-endopeptidase MepM n=1 Tax=Mariprofundus micogutta TaxID=1921010 RepID=A0A1L8CN76_9PROT|nr:peptidoglycan DD-metalloendopeptidase family protein [Mariprofundus micogutta]GAV20370.1 murein DD-endopeptidase MepM [Mariprofundus micogutta]
MPKNFNHDFSDRFANGNGNARKRAKKPRRLNFSLPKLTMPRLPRPGIFPVVGALVGFAFIMLFISSGGEDVNARSQPHEEWLTPELTLAADGSSQKSQTTLQPGDNAVSALMRLGFDRSTSHNIITAANSSYKLKNIRAGKTFKRADSEAGIEVSYNIDALQRLQMRLPAGEKTWQAELVKRKVYTRQRISSGSIEDSLFSSAARAGMDQRTTMNLVDIFAWDIDFARDMRSGDSFQVIYEERFDDEGRTLESSILAAKFVNQGREFLAARYEQANGKVDYFDPDGKSMRKAYLKAPVKFSRISSRFRLKRKHPVLGYTRAHRGVDYASPSGTPVHSIGDGYVTFAGWKGGYGRIVQIRHNNRNHTTFYAHLRKYGKGIKKGVRIRQGRVIGYVGMSGLATGPHLHFEFRSRGRAVNPLTIKHPPAKPIEKAEKEHFLQQTAPLLGSLKQPPTQYNWG